ncbi:aldehyde ferredoxin oxidoreductase C-terminal domain-containing protein [Geomonas propionica]|uniref:Aldehyde ferredoxin oxidoreductase n=1 Tax=Geomonas propionica TaxID=2798582 RepID=A0ABS0YWD6_9BACT|nr:aldehyde ferredoxin oxidoreductase C-terminal domain-containing protein [Geomonas propionica]MBJ6802248.1 aldehyde ferredoxin oxidoreductase [Geomonas propionica]
MDKIYRVNMSSLQCSVEPVPTPWAGLGGRALTSAIVAKEVPPTCHALGENNKLVFAPGMLSGTTAVNSGRLSAGAKSPLTGTIKESNAGGTAAQVLARLGVKALIIEGIPKGDGWYGLHVNSDGVTIVEETELIGKGNFAVIEALEKRLGKTGVLTIGPAGEMKMLAANISVRDIDGKLRSHGRGGLGAVMGSKRIKFIALDGEGTTAVSLADSAKFTQAARTFAQAIMNHPGTGQGLPTYGTAEMVNIVNAAGGLPTRNFLHGQYHDNEKISGETLRETIIERGGNPSHGCQSGCVIKCSQVFVDKKGKYVTSGLEYETIEILGANAMIGDLDVIAEADHLMDDIGIDSIETSVAIGVAMDGGVLPFGDGQGVLRLLREDLRAGTPLGRTIGSGAGNVGKLYGVTRVPVVKNQAIPAYDPRAIKGIGITYATSTMGADHTAGYAVATNLMGVGGGVVDPLKKDGQVELSRHLQIATVMLDSLGLCLFIGFPSADDPTCVPAIVDMLNARFGLELTPEWFGGLGITTLKTERAFNQAAGFTSEHDRLPEFFREPLAPSGAVWDFTGDEIDQFWNF